MKPPRPCPVCESQGERRVLHTMKFYEGVLGDGYDVVICSKCGAGFADGIPEQAELDRYYAEQSKYTYSANGGSESPYDIARFEIIVDQVAAYLPSEEARILDVGCATGGLLSAFKRRGYHNVIGADPSPACAQAARRLYDIEVRTSTIAQLHTWANQFDLVLVIGVLEHIREVHAALAALKSRLKPAGLLYIAVPDVEGFAECRSAPFQQFSMEHLNFFSKLSLSRVANSSGVSGQERWRYKTQWREGVTEPIVCEIYKLGNSSTAVFDDITEPAVAKYLLYSQKCDVTADEIIETLVENQEPILLWGAGTQARRLLATTSLGKANIVGFIDSNPHYAGRFGEFQVFAPQEIVARPESIVIASQTFAGEIIHAIRSDFKMTNPIITLGT